MYIQDYTLWGPSTLGSIPYLADLPPVTLSEEKSQEIFNLLHQGLVRNEYFPFSNLRDDLFLGDRGNDLNVMSRTMMQHYIDSYWKLFHPQLPICEYN